jgi:hypothetical protein
MRENRLSKWLGEHLVSEQTKTRGRLFAEEQRRLEAYEKNLAERTPEALLRKKKEKQALAIDFENEFGYVSDARIDDLARVFEHPNFVEKHAHLNLTFTEYVKMVASGRWKEYVCDHDEPPPSTILLKHHMRRLDVEQSKEKASFPFHFLIAVFFTLVVLFLLSNFVFFS